MAFLAACLAAAMLLALVGFFSLFLNSQSPLAQEVIRALALMGPYPERTELFPGAPLQQPAEATETVEEPELKLAA